MSSLYQISEDILRIFNDVENAEGEVTDEQYDALCIKQEELKTKLNDYVKAIKSWEADEAAIKEEKKAFNNRQNVYKNRIERLKSAALEAVIAFGESGKNNKFVELTNYRLFSRSSKSVDVDDKRIDIFMSEFDRYIRELVNADVLYADKNVDLEGILNCINANVKAAYGDDFQPYSIGDLIAMKINIYQTASIYDLFKSGMALNLYGKEPIYTHMENVTTKDDWKAAIESSNVVENTHPTMAKIVINQSLQIK